MAIKTLPRQPRHRTTGFLDPDRHSGSAPKDLGERIKRPDGHPLRYLDCTLTRQEYYRFRYNEVVA